MVAIKDSKAVVLVSSLPELTSADRCILKRRKKGSPEGETIRPPLLLALYNQLMGG